MSFFSNLFKKKNPNPTLLVQEYFRDKKRVQSTVEKHIDILTQTNLEDFQKLTVPNWDAWFTAMRKAKLPDGNFTIPESWLKLSPGEFLSSESKEAFIEAVLQPGPRAKLEIYRKLFGQSEIADLIAKQLHGAILAVNQKLNPLSQVFKSSGWEEQMYRIIQNFVPGMQNSLAEKFAEAGSDPRLQEILKNLIRIGLDLRWVDFQLPAGEEGQEAKEKWLDFFQMVAEDSQFSHGIRLRWEETWEAVPENWKKEKIRNLYFANERDYENFRNQVGGLITGHILDINENSKLMEKAIGVLVEDIIG